MWITIIFKVFPKSVGIYLTIFSQISTISRLILTIFERTLTIVTPIPMIAVCASTIFERIFVRITLFEWISTIFNFRPRPLGMQPAIAPARPGP